MVRAGLWAIAALWLVAAQALAGDGITTEGKLSNKDFFRLVTYGAIPGGECIGPVVRWPEPELTVALAPAHRRYPPELAEAVSDALDHAIAQINRAGAAIRITRDDRLRDPDIIISRPALSQGEKTRKIPRMPNGHTIGVGFMWLWWSERGEVTEASVLIAEDISLEDLHSVMLEELFQCLGFLYDIENPYYEGRSILSQDSNATTTLIGQDRMALRRLYP
jgi:hypothetical protein